MITLSFTVFLCEEEQIIYAVQTSPTVNQFCIPPSDKVYKITQKKDEISTVNRHVLVMAPGMQCSLGRAAALQHAAVSPGPTQSVPNVPSAEK